MAKVLSFSSEMEFGELFAVFKTYENAPCMLTSILFYFAHLFPRHDALKLGKDFAKQTKCSVSNIVCLLSLTPQAVLAAQMKTSMALQTPAYANAQRCMHSYIIRQAIGCLSAKDKHELGYWKTNSQKLKDRGPLKEQLE